MRLIKKTLKFVFTLSFANRKKLLFNSGLFNKIVFYFLLLFITLQAAPANAQILYSPEELWATGDLWKKTQAQWNAEKVRHDVELKKISNSNLSAVEADFRVNQEYKIHKAQSAKLARQRHEVQNILIAETNARVSGGKYATTEKANATLGTGIDDPGHRGMQSDLDMQAGEVTIEKMKGTLKDMGLETTLKFKENSLTPGTFEIEGDFDLCVHKTGLKPNVGDEMHKLVNGVDARNPEVYLSERMRDRTRGTKNAGTDYVEVQDHLKKARKGHVTSSSELVTNKKIMGDMAKGTKKTLDIGNINDKELGEILKKNGIKDSPIEFKKKLADIKTNDYNVKTSREAAKIRDASNDIFKKADLKARIQAAKDFKAKREQLDVIKKKVEKIDAMSDNPDTRARKENLRKELKAKELKIREELIDSKVKMEASKASNEEYFSDQRKPVSAGNDGPAKTKANVVETSTKTKANGTDIDKVKVDVDINVKSPDVYNKVKNYGSKGLKTFGDFMDIVDIGNACKKLQDYQEGKAELSEVIRAVVDMTPAGGVIGTGEKVYNSTSDYLESTDKIKYSNEMNMTAYLDQWYVRFRNAKMTEKDARRYISAAVLGGNFEILESKADLLRSQGKDIVEPKLIVENDVGPDGGNWYMWENAKEMASGMKKSTEEGVEYIFYAPGNIVVSWAEGELNEATLDFESQTATTDMKTRLFRKLLDAGIDRDRALEAVEGSQSQLKTVAKEAQENIKKTRAGQDKIKAEQEAFDEKLNGCMTEISRLRFADAFVDTNPTSPLKVPVETSNDGVFPVTVSLGGDLTENVGIISRSLERLTGTAPKVQYAYSFSVKSAKELTPSSWEVEVPGKPGNYPVRINVKVSITSFPGMYKPIHRTIFRTVKGVITVKPSVESIRFTEDSYELSTGFSHELKVEVSDKAPKGNYFYRWTIDGKSYNTTEPTTTYTPDFKKEECPKDVKASVILCDRETGILLDDTETKLEIIYEDIKDDLSLDGLWEIDMNSEVIYASSNSNDKNVSFQKATVKELDVTVEDVYSEKRNKMADQVLKFFNSKKIYFKKIETLESGFFYYYLYKYDEDTYENLVIRKIDNSSYEIFPISKYEGNYRIKLTLKNNYLECCLQYFDEYDNSNMSSYKYKFSRKKTPNSPPTLTNGNWNWDELKEDYNDELNIYSKLSSSEKNIFDLSKIEEDEDAYETIQWKIALFKQYQSGYEKFITSYKGKNSSIIKKEDLIWRLTEMHFIDPAPSRPYSATSSATNGWVKIWKEKEEGETAHNYIATLNSEENQNRQGKSLVSEFRWNPPAKQYQMDQKWDINFQKSGIIKANFQINRGSKVGQDNKIKFSLDAYDQDGNIINRDYINVYLECDFPDIYSDFSIDYKFELQIK